LSAARQPYQRFALSIQDGRVVVVMIAKADTQADTQAQAQVDTPSRRILHSTLIQRAGME